MLTPHGEALDVTGPLAHFQAHGYARLGPVLSQDAAAALADRAAALMGGRQPSDGMFFQHDSETGRYEDLVFNAGWIGPSDRYRKIERLEQDPLFAGFIENPLFERLATRFLGEGVTLYRAVLWNKAPRGGMAVPWHQDDGRFWGLNQAPEFQVWTALDDAPEAAGCLEVVPDSHKGGLASPEGGTLTGAALEAAQAQALRLPAARGESILVHNHTWHATGRNQTDHPRRAVSVSFLSADVRCTRRRRAPRQFRRLFQGLNPWPTG